MGTSTEFRGAIRIIPKIASPLAERMLSFFDIRHMTRDSDALAQLYPTIEAWPGTMRLNITL